MVRPGQLVIPAQLVHKAQQGQPAHKAMRQLCRGQLVRKASKACRAKPERRESRGQLVRRAHRVIPALRVRLAQHLMLLVLPDLPGRRASKVILDRPARKGRRVSKAYKATLGLLAQLAILAQLVQRVQRLT